MWEWMRGLVDEVTSWPGVSSHEHRFGGVEFRIGDREIGHAHSFGIVDIPFTVKIRDALIRAGRGERHHWLPDSGWTTVRVKEHGIDGVVNLLRLSYLRIQMKSGDSAAAEKAAAELHSTEIGQDVLEAVGVPAVAPRV